MTCATSCSRFCASRRPGSWYTAAGNGELRVAALPGRGPRRQARMPDKALAAIYIQGQSYDWCTSHMTGTLNVVLLSEPFGGVIPGARGAVLSALLRTDARLTGRQVHALVSERHSLWSVQEALKAWVQLGVVHTEIVGRAAVHAVNEDHYAVAPLRSLLDPMAALTNTVVGVVGDAVEAVIVFGSVARGQAHGGSDIDLAVIAHSSWEGRVDLEDAVRKRMGNDCDVLVFTTKDFARLAAAHEPILDEILADGIPLVGKMPRIKIGAA